MTTTNQPQFDVFLAHNSQDKPQVKLIADKLRSRGMTPWLDQEQIPPGRWFQDIIQSAIREVKSIAIFIGETGLGRWQMVELRSSISRCVDLDIPVIPVLLPGVHTIPNNLIFLKDLNWVTFANGIDDTEQLDRLEWGITGRKPSVSNNLNRADNKVSSGTPNQPIEVFFSYAHQDEGLRNKLEDHLSNLKQNGIITGWHDRKIAAGKEWRREIDSHLNAARIILLLISSDFMASDYCRDVELKRALERNKRGEARVIPVILRPVDWKDSLFGHLNPLPQGGKAVTLWSNRDQAFLSITEGIKAAMNELANN